MYSMFLRVDMPPSTASEWLGKRNQDGLSFSAVVENADACACGGKDGVIVGVTHCPKAAPGAHNLIIVSGFSHHQGNTATTAFLQIEEAKQLVNRLGEAIAAAERVAAEAAAQ
jgi:hypothetical protein